MKIIRLNGIKLDLNETEKPLAVKAAAILGIATDDIIALDIMKKHWMPVITSRLILFMLLE